MITISIDPGTKGGICFTGATPGTVETFKMPATPKDVCDLITTAKEIAEMNSLPIRCVMEEVGGFAGVGQPGSAMFNFGRGFGNLEGFLICLGIQFELVRPQKWQKAVGLNFPPVHKGDYNGMTPDQKSLERKRVSSLNAKRKRDNKNLIKEMAQRLYPKLKVTLETADALMILTYAFKAA
jgi:hypothetical protein